MKNILIFFDSGQDKITNLYYVSKLLVSNCHFPIYSRIFQFNREQENSFGVLFFQFNQEQTRKQQNFPI